MSVFPKNILVKIIKHAIDQDCISVQNARLVCKIVLNDFDIKDWFHEIVRVINAWNALRYCARNTHMIGIKTNLNTYAWQRIGRRDRQVGQYQIMVGTEVEFYLSRQSANYRIIRILPNAQEQHIQDAIDGTNLARKRPREIN